MPLKNDLHYVAKKEFFKISKTSNVICRQFWILKNSAPHTEQQQQQQKQEPNTSSKWKNANLTNHYRHKKGFGTI